VVAAAKEALAKGDITPVLKWIKPENEAEVREVFKKALAVRGKGPEAQELADMYFFETLVRIHRAGEGAPYTGLKAEEIEPPVAAADKALETGSVEDLVKMVTAKVVHGIRDRFQETLERKKHANDSVAAGREFVEAYVPFTTMSSGSMSSPRERMATESVAAARASAELDSIGYVKRLYLATKGGGHTE
jgi:hypothetical protein